MQTATRKRSGKGVVAGKLIVVTMLGVTPTSPNVLARAHWSLRKAEVDFWRAKVSAAFDPHERLALRKNAQKEDPAVVRIFAHLLHAGKGYDPDNAVGALKSVLDGIVNAGLLYDDSSAFVSIKQAVQSPGVGPGLILILAWSD